LNPDRGAGVDPDVIGALSTAVLLAAGTHDVATTPSNT